jgi:hypothetical protein
VRPQIIAGAPFKIFNMKQKKRWILLVAAAVIVFIIGLFVSKDNGNSYKPNKNTIALAAYSLAQGAILKQLKAPATAKFPDKFTYLFRNNRIYISSYVDAQNSYGAILRTNWNATLQYDSLKQQKPYGLILLEAVTKD